MPSSPDDLNLVVNKLIEKTETGAIQWVAVNPTTYAVVRPTGRLLIQRVPISTGRPARDPSTGRIQIETADTFAMTATNLQGEALYTLRPVLPDPINQLLGKLYNAIVAKRTQQGLDFLKSIIPD